MEKFELVDSHSGGASIKRILVDALYRSMDSLRGRFSSEEQVELAIYWIAFAKLHALSGGAASVGQLVTSDTARKDSGAWRYIPSSHREDYIWAIERISRVPEVIPFISDLLNQLKPVIAEHAEEAWPLDSVLVSISRRTAALSHFPLVEPSVVNHLFAELQAPTGSVVWLPFDRSGQLTVEALRRGLVPVFKPLEQSYSKTRHPLHAPLVLAALSGKQIRDELGVLSAHEGTDTDKLLDYVLVVPPIGVHLDEKLDGYRDWLDSVPLKNGDFAKGLKLRRSEVHAIAKVLPRVKGRSVFLASGGVLFSKGQEQRLRQALLENGHIPESVYLLPRGTFLNAGVNASILVFNSRIATFDVYIRFVELEGKEPFFALPRVFNHLPERDAIEISEEDGITISQVSTHFSSVEKNNYSFQPSLYLIRLEFAPDTRTALGNLVEIIKSAPFSRTSGAADVHEVGIPELGSFVPIQLPTKKRNRLEARRLPRFELQPGDLVLSIKGTVGKSGLYAPRQLDKDPAVVSTSCVGLRIINHNLSPEALLAYLNSDDFELQLRSRQVGATISSLTIESLGEMQIPTALLEGEVRARFEATCARLAALEEQITDLQFERSRMLVEDLKLDQ